MFLTSDRRREITGKKTNSNRLLFITKNNNSGLYALLLTIDFN